jgi:glycerol-3-phosphate dehydrogenase
MPRSDSLRALREQVFDLLVVGGGIIGTGIARDAALRGLRVALVEQNDLASGTTSRPTRLIHGGLRYLEIFDFGLVRSDMREREILLRVAPHLVFPLPFLLPVYRASWFYQSKLRAGMQLYDILSFDKSLPTRRWLHHDQTLAAEPTLARDGLVGAWRFFDAQVPLVERLAVENALDAASHGAEIVNHARVATFSRDGARVTGATVRDTLQNGELQVRARLTVNATGPWLDLTDQAIRPGRPPLLRLTKGVHVVTPSGTQNAHLLFAHRDGRLFFVVPWLGYSLIGTTDTDYPGDPADAAATRDDVDYLVSEAQRAIPGAAKTFNHVHYTMAGVRALVRVEGVREGQVSRKHALFDHETREGVPGLISVIGGKITAYRGIAEEVVDLVVRKLGRRAPGYTDRRLLPGGHLGSARNYLDHHLWPRAQGLGLTRGQAERLAMVYGSLAEDVLDRIAQDQALGEPLCPHEPTLLAQLVRAVEQEWAVTLGDVLLRRTELGLTACQGLECVREIAAHMARLLGWDGNEQAEQVAAYRREIEPMRRFSRQL